jgi:hypothetical protein
VTFGARLSARLGAPLLLLCTPGQEGFAVEFARRGHPATEGWALALPWPASIPVAGLRTADHARGSNPKYLDIAAKRDVALAVARLCGWESFLLLDDDVREITPTQVREAASTTVGGALAPCVSWVLDAFPDNSVVCHARRLVGRRQDSFVGSGAMLVRPVASQFFPPVYNEDWLFMFDLLPRRQVVRAGKVGQLRFDPFADPARARHEEFGDTLGEGLYHLLHEDVPVEVALHEPYWRDVVRNRVEMIREVERSLRAIPGSASRQSPANLVRIRHALASVEAAIEVHERDWLATDLAAFVDAWRADRVTWSKWFHDLPRVDALQDAVAVLGIPPTRLTAI